MARLSAPARAELGAGDQRGNLTVNGRPVDLDVALADTLLARSVGLLGRREVTDALLLHPCSSVHSLGMLVDLEVAYLDADLRVLEVVDLPRWRMHRPRRRAAAVLESGPGGLSGRGLVPGVRVGIGRGPA